jgi:hypothetical protein
MGNLDTDPAAVVAGKYRDEGRSVISLRKGGRQNKHRGEQDHMATGSHRQIPGTSFYFLIGNIPQVF